MSYTVIQTSGKQFLFKQGEWQDIDLISQSSLGDYIFLSKLLLFKKGKKIQIGKPFLNGEIPAQIIQKVKGPKVVVLKTKPKKRYTRKKGHRQFYTRIQIN